MNPQTEPNRTLPTPENSAPLSARWGGEFLKAPEVERLRGTAQHFFFEIEARPTTRENAQHGILGPAPGRFGVDVPFTAKGKTYIATIRTRGRGGQDYADLVAEIGNDPSKWVGRSLACWTEVVERDDGVGNVESISIIRYSTTEGIVASLPQQKSIVDPESKGDIVWGKTPSVKRKASRGKR
jgi:hypothetical protein